MNTLEDTNGGGTTNNVNALLKPRSEAKKELIQALTRQKTVRFNYTLVNRAATEKLSVSEVRELSRLYSELDRKHQDLIHDYITLLMDNNRLVNENEFMLRLIKDSE